MSTGIESDTTASGSASAKDNEAEALQPSSKVDDKVAALEDKLLEKDASFNRERFVYISAVGTLIAVLIGCVAPAYVFLVVLAILIAVFIGLAHWLDFPWVITYFDRIFDALIERIKGKEKPSEPDTEPRSQNLPKPEAADADKPVIEPI